jgi:hypothetical protein
MKPRHFSLLMSRPHCPSGVANMTLKNSAERIAYVDHFMDHPDDANRLRSLKAEALRASGSGI